MSPTETKVSGSKQTKNENYDNYPVEKRYYPDSSGFIQVVHGNDLMEVSKKIREQREEGF